MRSRSVGPCFFIELTELCGPLGLFFHFFLCLSLCVRHSGDSERGSPLRRPISIRPTTAIADNIRPVSLKKCHLDFPDYWPRFCFAHLGRNWPFRFQSGSSPRSPRDGRVLLFNRISERSIKEPDILTNIVSIESPKWGTDDETETSKTEGKGGLLWEKKVSVFYVLLDGGCRRRRRTQCSCQLFRLHRFSQEGFSLFLFFSSLSNQV